LQVVIEIEDRQVDAAQVANAQEDVLFGDSANLGMEASNLLVEAFFVASVLADQDGKDWLVRLSGDALGGCPIIEPDRLLVGRLRREQRRAACQTDDEQGQLESHDDIPNYVASLYKAIVPGKAASVAHTACLARLNGTPRCSFNFPVLALYPARPETVAVYVSSRSFCDAW
jgi:hypothetical protein